MLRECAAVADSSTHRMAGILLHPTSLPGPFGIGDLGPSSHAWIEFLRLAGCDAWQILPLGPTGYGDSPYQTFSSFAGNPLLVSPDLLESAGLVSVDAPNLPRDHVDYGPVIEWKTQLLDAAYDTYAGGDSGLEEAFGAFKRRTPWLEDFTLFMSLKAAHGGGPWTEWDRRLRLRDPEALQDARRRYGEQMDRVAFAQYLFFEQWARVRTHAASRGITIIGDVPIFVAEDSADVWARPELFQLDADGHPTVVAGVPPDYFSPTGQLWGNPLYRWPVHASEDYAWWAARLSAALHLVDLVRIDHFRAFADYWEIPAGAPTAETGRWLPGPGDDFLRAMRRHLGEDIPIIAEDLGELSPIVYELRDHWELPGMKVLQFAFDGDPDNPFLPENYPERSVAYTGTHDNDTTLGWWHQASNAERANAAGYVTSDDVAWDLIRAVWQSRARIAVAPLQDFLRLGTSARMNTPGHPTGNWSWRIAPHADLTGLVAPIRRLNETTNRGQVAQAG